MTLAFDLPLNLILTNAYAYILLDVSTYCGKYEVFGLEMTLTLVLDLEMTLSLVISSPHGVIV